MPIHINQMIDIPEPTIEEIQQEFKKTSEIAGDAMERLAKDLSELSKKHFKTYSDYSWCRFR